MESPESLQTRSGGKCELCGATQGLAPHALPPRDAGILACAACRTALAGTGKPDPIHCRCLQESAWSAEPAVQVAAWRLLQRLADEPFAADLLGSIYLEDDTRAWAEAAGEETDKTEPHKDAHGALLAEGDTITLIKDLEVKGAGFTAKRGTAVRNIRLVAGNSGHIEGRVNGVQIVILTQFVKKA